MSTNTITAEAVYQPALFDMDVVYSEADRQADRELCQNYLRQWSSGFKKPGAQPSISREDFEAAGQRLGQ